MIVSWNWLKQYVTLAMPAEEIARRLMMAGLNHESTAAVGDDLAIDLEVTSNRPDCLGHLGIAREIAVLTGQHAEGPARAAAGRAPRRWASWSACGSTAPTFARVIRPGWSAACRSAEPAVARRPAGDRGHGGDQQRRGHLQLRAHGVRPAAAHLRLRQAPRAGDHRPPAAPRRDHRGHRPQDLRPGAGDVRHRRRAGRGGHRRRDGRGRHGSLAGRPPPCWSKRPNSTRSPSAPRPGG